MSPFEFLLSSYEGATQGWMGYAVEAGLEVFRKLAALELIVFGFLVALKSRGGLPAVIPDLTWKLFLISLFLTGLLVYPLWIPTITPSFAQLAHHITGFSTLNPAVVIEQGIALSLGIMASGFAAGWLGPSFAGALWVILASIGVLVSYVAIATILARTLIESWIVLATGPLISGFAPFRLTAQLADNFIVYAFQVGIRLFFLIVLMSAARGAATEWLREIATHPLTSYGVLLEVLGGAVLLAVVLWTLPARISDVLTRGWHLGLRQGLSD